MVKISVKTSSSSPLLKIRKPIWLKINEEKRKMMMLVEFNIKLYSFVNIIFFCEFFCEFNINRDAFGHLTVFKTLGEYYINRNWLMWFQIKKFIQIKAQIQSNGLNKWCFQGSSHQFYSNLMLLEHDTSISYCEFVEAAHLKA